MHIEWLILSHSELSWLVTVYGYSCVRKYVAAAIAPASSSRDISGGGVGGAIRGGQVGEGVEGSAGLGAASAAGDDATGGVVCTEGVGAEHADAIAIRTLAATRVTVAVVVRRDTGAPWHSRPRRRAGYQH